MTTVSFFLRAARFADVCHHRYHSCLIFCDWYLLGSEETVARWGHTDLHTVFREVLHHWSYGFGGGRPRRSAPRGHYLTSLLSQGKQKRLRHNCLPFSFWVPKVGDIRKFILLPLEILSLAPTSSPQLKISAPSPVRAWKGSLDTEPRRAPLGKFQLAFPRVIVEVSGPLLFPLREIEVSVFVVCPWNQSRVVDSTPAL